MAKKKRTTTKVTPLTLARQRRFETPNEHEEEEDDVGGKGTFLGFLFLCFLFLLLETLDFLG